MVYGEPFLPGYEFVDSISGYECYEWAELRIYRKISDDRLFYASANGCSCDGFEEQITEEDLIELQSLGAGQRAVKEFLQGYSSYFSEGNMGIYLDAVETLRGLELR